VGDNDRAAPVVETQKGNLRLLEAFVIGIPNGGSPKGKFRQRLAIKFVTVSKCIDL
jgi:hypothetical protein